MVLVEVLVALGVLFAVGAVVAVRRTHLRQPERDTTDTRVPPAGALMAPGDVDSLRFGLAFRGYRMDQVDDALDRLREEMRRRDDRIAELEADAARRRTPALAAPSAVLDEQIEPIEEAATTAVAAAAPAPEPEPPSVPLAPTAEAPVDEPVDEPAGVGTPKISRARPKPTPAEAPAAPSTDRISKLRRARTPTDAA